MTTEGQDTEQEWGVAAAGLAGAATIGRDARRDSWVETLAHELNNPLGAVLMALELLRPACGIDPSTREAREIAERGLRQMARVIDDVLDLCRGAHGKLTVRREPVDVRHAVAGAVAAARPAIAACRHSLAVSIPRDVPLLDAHPSRLEQVITNLLANAANFTNPGGRIWLAVEHSAGEVIIRVRDDGIGISPDLLPRVFDPHVQGPRGPGRPSAGLGIGLALVRSLVRLMGGSVSARSDGLGHGAEFVVRLRVWSPEPKARTGFDVSASPARAY